MFGLTPRSSKTTTPPAPDFKSSASTSPVRAASKEVRRLAQELETVLGQTPPAHRVAAEPRADVHRDVMQSPSEPATARSSDAKQRPVPLDTVEGNADFDWTPDDDADVAPDHDMSRVWLKRAQRENRRNRVRLAAQRLLIVTAIVAGLMLAAWPGLS